MTPTWWTNIVAGVVAFGCVVWFGVIDRVPIVAVPVAVPPTPPVVQSEMHCVTTDAQGKRRIVTASTFGFVFSSNGGAVWSQADGTSVLCAPWVQD